jgi:flagellar motor switch protein FliN/FliY
MTAAQAAAAAKNANGDANGQAAAPNPAEASLERVVPEPLAKSATSEPDLPKLKPPAANLPVELDVGVPVPEFRVRNLLNLEPGRVIESRWGHADDVPLAAGAVRLAWVEFEVIENQLAVRVTRLG